LKPTVCTAIQASFSAYLDGAVSGHEMQEISRHIEGFEDASTGSRTAACEACASEFAAWRLTQNALAMLRPAKAPADLGLKLRLAISHENARRTRLLDRISLAWDNTVRPMLLQVSGGVAGTIILVGGMLLLGFVAAPQAVLANDEPLGAMTAPHYRYSTALSGSGTIVTGYDTAIVVEALIDSRGRVYDYNIVSGPQDQAVRIQVENQLLGSVFQPASVFGLPVRGHVVVTFAGISVRG
jgi:anti-sigma factor RsiW